MGGGTPTRPDRTGGGWPPLKKVSEGGDPPPPVVRARLATGAAPGLTQSDIPVQGILVVDGDNEDHQDTVVDGEDCPVLADPAGVKRHLLVAFEFPDAGPGILFSCQFIENSPDAPGIFFWEIQQVLLDLVFPCLDLLYDDFRFFVLDFLVFDLFAPRDGEIVPVPIAKELLDDHLPFLRVCPGAAGYTRGLVSGFTVPGDGLSGTLPGYFLRRPRFVFFMSQADLIELLRPDHGLNQGVVEILKTPHQGRVFIDGIKGRSPLFSDLHHAPVRELLHGFCNGLPGEPDLVDQFGHIEFDTVHRQQERKQPGLAGVAE